MPMLIERPQRPHPSARMADLGVRLERIRVTHPEPNHLRAQLDALGAAHLVALASSAGAPTIELELRAPGGASVTLR
jgi:hypothetical protein